MYGLGSAKPEYIMRDKMMSDPGAKACASVRELAAIVLKSIAITIVIRNVVKTKKKKPPASRRKLVMKYSGTLNVTAFRILYGISVSIEANASAEGWYNA